MASPATSLVLSSFVFLRGCNGENLCTKSQTYDKETQQYVEHQVSCTYGCCGQHPQQYCCTVSVEILAGGLVGAFLGLCLLVLLVYCCVKKCGPSDNSIQPTAQAHIPHRPRTPHNTNINVVYGAEFGPHPGMAWGYRPAARRARPVKPPPYRARDGPPPPYHPLPLPPQHVYHRYRLPGVPGAVNFPASLQEPELVSRESTATSEDMALHPGQGSDVGVQSSSAQGDCAGHACATTHVTPGSSAPPPPPTEVTVSLGQSGHQATYHVTVQAHPPDPDSVRMSVGRSSLTSVTSGLNLSTLTALSLPGMSDANDLIIPEVEPSAETTAERSSCSSQDHSD